jgi:hypothetical protein
MSILLLVLSMVLVSVAPSQVFRITDVVFGSSSKAAVQLKNSATDSVTQLDIIYNGTSYQLTGAFPDSVRIRWFATADSTQRVLIRLKQNQRFGSTYSSVLLDSVKSSTKAVSQGSHTLTGAQFLQYDYLGVSLVAADTINATVKANASKIYLTLDRFFHK